MSQISYPLKYAVGQNSVQSFPKTQYAKVKEIIDQVNTNTTDITTINSYETTNVSPIYTVEVTLTATQIVGTAAGDIGHANGAILVDAPGAGKALEFISAVIIYDYDKAAYTGGNNDGIIRVGSTAVTTALTDGNYVKATSDRVYRLGAIATEVSLSSNATINLAGTAFTQPGTADGILRIQVLYRVHTTGL